MNDNTEGRSATNGGHEDSATDEPSKRGVREWLADLFAGDADELSELMEGLRDAAGRGLFNEEALNMFLGALHVADMHARDIMIPRSALVVVQEDQDPDALLPIIIEARHSRFPVVGDDVDDIKGIL